VGERRGDEQTIIDVDDGGNVEGGVHEETVVSIDGLEV
jgi:hypothetical protein